MNSKMTTNSKLSTTEPKKTKTKIKKNQAKDWNRNRFTEIEITWLSVGRERGDNGGKGTGNKKHK